MSNQIQAASITALGVAYITWYDGRDSQAEPDDMEAFSAGYSAGNAAAEARAAALEAQRDQYRAAVAAADDLARVLDQEVMPRYMELIDAYGLGDSVVDPMSRQALDAYRDARAALAGQPAADWGGGGF